METLAQDRAREQLNMLRRLLEGPDPEKSRFTVADDGDALIARPAGVDVPGLRITCEPWPVDCDRLWFWRDHIAFEAAEALDLIETAACLVAARLLGIAREAQKPEARA